MLDRGFKDAYREVFPDPIRFPGFTWTPTTLADDPKDRHDRIDFVLVGGQRSRVEKAEIVGEALGTSDIAVTPYPSDHRAVVVTVKLE